MAQVQAERVALKEAEGSDSLLKNRQFLFLWVATTLTGLAFSMYLITESWFVVRGLNHEAWLGIVMIATTIPRILLMSLGGVLADRFKRSYILCFSTVSRGILISVMVVLLIQNHLSIYLLLGFACCFGLLDAFFWPSSNSFIPLIVRKENITRANSFIQTSSQFSLMVGPAIAGFVIKFGSFQGAFGTSAVLLIVSGLIVIGMREVKGAEGEVEMKKKKASVFQDLKEGLMYVKGMPYILLSMFTSVTVNLFLTGPVNVGLPILVAKVLKGDVLDLSYLETTLSLGMFVGAIITGLVNFKRRRSVISLVLVGILGISCALLSQMTSIWYGIAVILIAGVALGISEIVAPSLAQELIEPKMMGRVQSLMSTASMGFTPISYALVSVLISIGVSIQPIMLISCLIMSLFCFVVLWKVKLVWEVD